MSNVHERLSDLSTQVRELAILAETMRRNPDNVPANTTPYRIVIDKMKKLLEQFEKDSDSFETVAPASGTNSALLRRHNVSFRMAPRIEMNGVSWTLHDGLLRNKRLSPVIQVHHIDAERDKHLKSPLSNFNLNYVFADNDDRDHVLKFARTPDPKYLPKTSDLRSNFGDILNQSTLGASAIHAVAYNVRFVVQKINKKLTSTPSRLYLYWYARKEASLPTDLDTGVSIRDAFKAVTHHGICPEMMMPYDVNAFTQEPSRDCQDASNKFPKIEYMTVDQTGPAIKKCLKDGYPINFACVLFNGFMTENVAKTGEVPMPEEDQARCGCQALTIVGHDDSKDIFIVANSWGSDWGDGGFCKMPYAYILDHRYASDFWTCRPE